MLVITVRPMTTALQAKRSASWLFDCDQIRHVLAERPLAVVVERGRIPDRLAGGERAEAGVEVVVAGVDQFHRNHAAAEHAADLLMAGGVAAHAVAGVQRVAAEERVAGAFEAEVLPARRRCRSRARRASGDCRALRPAAGGWRKRESSACRPKISAALAVNTRSGRPATGSSSETARPGLRDVLDEATATARRPPHGRPAATCSSTD